MEGKNTGFTDFIDKNGEVILRVDNDSNVLEIDSRTGRVRLNGCELHKVSRLNINIEGYGNVTATIDMDVDEDEILLLIEGKVKWFKGTDREKILHDQRGE